MLKSLVIVESPAKARTIKKYLGDNFEVKASIGHVIDLPKNTMGIDLESGNFELEYVPISGKNKIIKDIQIESKKFEFIYLATDQDREGEAIAFHLYNIIREAKNNKKQNILRIRFNEITKNVIEKSLQIAGDINYNLYNAQKTRRILDRIVGYKISPILWKNVRRGISAGRVQSSTVRIIVNRENQINKFIQNEYWNVEVVAIFMNGFNFLMQLFKSNNNKINIINENEALNIKKNIEFKIGRISKIERKNRRRSPDPPFITSKLQQYASRYLNFSPKKTMRIAQTLYEGIELGSQGLVGLITYMRTDSVIVSLDSIKDARKYIDKEFGKEYLTKIKKISCNKNPSQEAHEAIRPTSVNNTPNLIKSFLNDDQFKLYKIIWKKFVSSQMKSSIYSQIVINISFDEYIFKALSSVLFFDGFLIVNKKDENEDNNNHNLKRKENETLSSVIEGEKVELSKVNIIQHFTKPPFRYNEASLIKELEENGIGRPSTYASILSNIQDRGYVEKIENKLYPSELGVIVNQLLVDCFPMVLDVSFTAKIEKLLDKISCGKANYLDVLRDFYCTFEKNIIEAKSNMRNIKLMEEKTDVRCNLCSGYMVIKWSKSGTFLGCLSYPKCRNIKSYKKINGKILIVEIENVNMKCKICNDKMSIKKGKYGDFLGCSSYPNCNFSMSISTGIKCPINKCIGDLILKSTKKKRKFYACSNYPDCKFLSWNKPVLSKCIFCNFEYLIQKKIKDEIILECINCKNINRNKK